MTTKKPKRGLGRGLDALLGAGTSGQAMPVGLGFDSATDSAVEAIRPVSVELLQKGRYQPRQTIDDSALDELAESIKMQGVVQPILIRPVTDGRYEIIAGERRWRAAQRAGLEIVPAIVRELSDQAALAIALIENIQREDLNPLEEAQALQRLQLEFDLTHQAVADAVGRSRTAVTNLLRLLELAESVQTMLIEGKLDMGHARALLSLPLELQHEAAQLVSLRGLSVRETEQLVRRMQADKTSAGAGKPSRSTPPPMDPNIRELRDSLADRLGARIAIEHAATGKGRLVISYNSLDELDGILAHIK